MGELPDIYDGRIRKPDRRRGPIWPWIVFVLVALGAGVWFMRDDIPIPGRGRIVPGSPAKVVRQRPGGARKAPGAKLNEPEAIQALRRHFAAQGIKNECIATVSKGSSGGAYDFDVVNRCDEARLGRWRVDFTTGSVYK